MSICSEPSRGLVALSLRLGRLGCRPYQGPYQFLNARSPTCSSTTFGGLGRNETGRLLGLFTARPSWLPAVGHPLCPQGVMTLVEDSTCPPPRLNQLRVVCDLGPALPLPRTFPATPRWAQALPGAWGRGGLYLEDPGRLPVRSGGAAGSRQGTSPKGLSASVTRV